MKKIKFPWLYIICVFFVLYPTVALSASAQWGIISPNEAEDKQTKKSVSIPIFTQIIVLTLPPDWSIKPVHENVTQQHYIVEYLPKGQTLTNWHEMITLQGFKNLASAPQMSPKVLLSMLGNQIRKVCSDSFVVKYISSKNVDSYNAMSAVIGCGEVPNNHPSGIKKGQGEFGYYVAIKGNNEMYLVNRSWRGGAYSIETMPIDQDDLSTWISNFKTIKVCEKNNKIATECWEREIRD